MSIRQTVDLLPRVKYGRCTTFLVVTADEECAIMDTWIVSKSVCTERDAIVCGQVDRWTLRNDKLSMRRVVRTVHVGEIYFTRQSHGMAVF